MAGRGPQSFKKRQKEQQRKEKQLEKAARKLERKRNPQGPDSAGNDAEDDIEAYEIDESLDRPQTPLHSE
jgi:hypothetical protein